MKDRNATLTRTLLAPLQVGTLLTSGWAAEALANDECRDRYYEAHCAGPCPYDDGTPQGAYQCAVHWPERSCIDEANRQGAEAQVTFEDEWEDDYWEWNEAYCREVNTRWERKDYQDVCEFDGSAVGGPYSVETGVYFFGNWEYCGC